MNVKLSNSQPKSAIKNETDAVLRLSSNMIGNSDETNFPHKLLLTNRQVANFIKSLLTAHQLILNCQQHN